MFLERVPSLSPICAAMLLVGIAVLDFIVVPMIEGPPAHAATKVSLDCEQFANSQFCNPHGTQKPELLIGPTISAAMLLGKMETTHFGDKK